MPQRKWQGYSLSRFVQRYKDIRMLRMLKWITKVVNVGGTAGQLSRPYAWDGFLF